MCKVRIELITYERDRLDYFTALMAKAQRRYRRLFKKYQNAPLLSAETEMLNEAGRVAHFYGDVVEMLEKEYREQSEGEWDQSAYGELKCSVCGIVQEDYPHMYNFCPNCGAKMKGGAE